MKKIPAQPQTDQPCLPTFINFCLREHFKQDRWDSLSNSPGSFTSAPYNTSLLSPSSQLEKNTKQFRKGWMRGFITQTKKAESSVSRKKVQTDKKKGIRTRLYQNEIPWLRPKESFTETAGAFFLFLNNRTS